MLVSRMVRAAFLSVGLYEEVERDRDATEQALLVVLIASVASGIGGGLSRLAGDGGTGGLVAGLLWGAVGAVLGWAAFSLFTYWIGATFLGGRATYGELLRTVGFAYSPQVLHILGFVPCIGNLIRLLVWLWVLATMVIAVRQALDFDTGRAVITAVLGWIVLVVVQAVVGIFLGGFALALF